MRTFVYVGAALVLCFLIGYPVAYYVARSPGGGGACCSACSSRRSGSTT